MATRSRKRTRAQFELTHQEDAAQQDKPSAAIQLKKRVRKNAPEVAVSAKEEVTAKQGWAVKNLDSAKDTAVTTSGK